MEIKSIKVNFGLGNFFENIFIEIFVSIYFKNALLRKPPLSVSRAISSKKTPPSYEGIAEEHLYYTNALNSVGLNIHTLPELEDFPDSIFVEDPALTFENGCIVLRPGAQSRFKEKDALELDLKKIFERVLVVEEGSVEGGDILRVGDHCIIGLSERTNKTGAQVLSTKLLDLGVSSEIAITPPGVLHFKSDCCLLDEETIFCTQRLYDSGFFRDKEYKIILVPSGEEVTANSLRINDTLFVPDGYKKTADLLNEKYNIELLEVNEVSKVDAGLSCMSLRW